MPIDYKRYPPNWKTEIVPSVRNRSGGCCENCGLKNGQIVFSVKMWIKDIDRYKIRSIWFSDEHDAIREAGSPLLVKSVRVVLTVAHLDHDEENHDVSIDRLKDLCQICHLRYDAEEKYRRQMVKWNKTDH
ncbi:MAG TPA: hypothetical protein PLZ45_06830 [Ferruginibacter sp.]|nr:hypothetical protein [Ferruginibacter sp.]